MKALEITVPLGTSLNPGYYYDSYLGRYLYWDGQFWYVYAAGLLYPATIWEPSPYPPIVVSAGDTVRIFANFKYTGPAIASGYAIYGAIGTNVVGIFNEKLYGETNLTLPECTAETQFTDKYVSIPITTAMPTGVTYAIYIKIKKGISDVIISAAWENCVTVAGVEPVFTEFGIKSYERV